MRELWNRSAPYSGCQVVPRTVTRVLCSKPLQIGIARISQHTIRASTISARKVRVSTLGREVVNCHHLQRMRFKWLSPQNSFAYLGRPHLSIWCDGPIGLGFINPLQLRIHRVRSIPIHD